MATKTKREKFLFPLTIEEFDSLFRGMLRDLEYLAFLKQANWNI
jgi:hypothetical protein